MSEIKTWAQRCDGYPYGQIVTNATIREMMQEEIDELRARLGAEIKQHEAQPLRELSELEIETLYALFRGKEISHSRHVWLPFANAVLTAARKKP